MFQATKELLKKSFIFTALISNLLIAQRVYTETEINFQTINASSVNQQTVFLIKPVDYSTVFENQTFSYRTPVYRAISNNNCDVAMDDIGDQTLTLVGEVHCVNSGLEYTFYGENLSGNVSCSGQSAVKPFANALYEIRIKVDGVDKFVFYLDTRHDNLPNRCTIECYGNDISIVYSISNNTVGGGEDFWYYGEPLLLIEQNRYYTWWEIRNNNCGVELSRFNSQYMPVLLEPSNVNNSPRLQWQSPTSSSARRIF